MPLREGDIKKNIKGKVIWIIGRGNAGKSTLIRAIRERLPNVISLDDHLRVRVGIMGAELKAYEMMIGLAWSLAFQGFDCLVPCGAQNLELRDYIRSKVPSSLFIYIAERGRYYDGYDEPNEMEDILTLDADLTIEQEVEIVLKTIWKMEPTTS